MAAERHVVEGIPLLVVVPEPEVARSALALWLPFLSGRKELVEPVCRRLAVAGFHAVSFDPWRHGERADPDVDLLATVMAGFRRQMWPILGRSVLDGLQVLDWASATYGLTQPAVAGGVSMGGDIAVALAGLDPRIARVAVIGSTPDWARPGMTVLGEPDRLLDQGEADACGSWLYRTTDPASHPERYLSRPAIAFETGADDRHIPPEHAEAFAAAVAEAGGTAPIRVTRHPGLDHVGSGQDEAVLQRCLDWLGGDDREVDG